MEPFIGQLICVAFNFAPRGFASCQGQLLSIAQNTALFSLLGTTYGGDGRTTFGLPDLRGRVPLSSGQGPGLQNYALGEQAGAEYVTLTVGELPMHPHSLDVHSGEATSPSPEATVPATLQSPGYAPTPNATAAANAIGSAGGNSPHENRLPFTTLNWCIATEGVFPSRN